MKRKSLHISEDLHRSIEIACFKQNISIKNYVSSCLEYCLKEDVNLKQPVILKEIKDTFIKFIRTQEKIYLLPAQEHTQSMIDSIEEIDFNINALKVRLNALDATTEAIFKRLI